MSNDVKKFIIGLSPLAIPAIIMWVAGFWNDDYFVVAIPAAFFSTLSLLSRKTIAKAFSFSFSIIFNLNGVLYQFLCDWGASCSFENTLYGIILAVALLTGVRGLFDKEAVSERRHITLTLVSWLPVSIMAIFL